MGAGDGHQVVALHADSGTLKWAFYTSYAVFSSPAIGANGTIYIESGNGTIHALDGETGRQKWHYLIGGEHYSSAAIGRDGTVFIGAYWKKIYAFDGKSGNIKWEFLTDGSVRSCPAIGADGTHYFGSGDKTFYAIDEANGIKKWAYESAGAIRSSPTIGNDGTVYVGSYHGKNYAFYSDSPGLASSPWPKCRADICLRSPFLIASPIADLLSYWQMASVIKETTQNKRAVVREPLWFRTSSKRIHRPDIAVEAIMLEIL